MLTLGQTIVDSNKHGSKLAHVHNVPKGKHAFIGQRNNHFNVALAHKRVLFGSILFKENGPNVLGQTASAAAPAVVANGNVPPCLHNLFGLFRSY